MFSNRSNIVVLIWAWATVTGLSQPSPFVTQTSGNLELNGHPFYFVGGNAYYLMEEAARGDTTLVKNLFATARQLGMTVIRTWGFFDSGDTLNPAVIQWRPGGFNEAALRALDYVIWQAKQSGLRLVIPLVNNWDDYGGMNQDVRWRMAQGDHNRSASEVRFTESDQQRTVLGLGGRLYRVAMSDMFGHDDFYTDVTIRNWYKSYVSVILGRVNTLTGVVYRNEPTILAWELANEPRSSDRSGVIVSGWADDVSLFLKQLDTNHLVGTGEEGFDNSVTGYSIPAYNNQLWLVDGTAGVSFTMNLALRHIDLAGIHMYPQSWGLNNNGGNIWIRDHVRMAATAGKPLVLGEFGVLVDQPATYDSWLTTVLLDGGGGALVWQLSEGARGNNDGYGIRCPGSGSVCTVLQDQARMFTEKSAGSPLSAPPEFLLFQNYPNPFNGQTTIAYALPSDANVTLSLYNSVGELVRVLVDGFQHAGTRKELLSVEWLSSGVYFYQANVQLSEGRGSSGTKKLVIVK
ncbi:MAG TPA: hypothetical protein DGH68_10260 [Bacteroidetes bacterium]|nr:hypothetical protein [Bacteroidota bacterium]